MSRRDLFSLIGTVAGSAVMYEAMNSLAYGAESGFTGTPNLTGAPQGRHRPDPGLRLGRHGLGLRAAEGRLQGQDSRIPGPSGRPELVALRRRHLHRTRGFTQKVQFDKGNYINPGPWRIPYHHQGVLTYAKMLGVQLEPFIQTNYNAYIHSTKAFGGKPQRFRHLQGRRQRLRGRTAVQVHPPERARRRAHQGRPGDPAAVPAQLGRARRRLQVRQGRGVLRPPAASDQDPGGRPHLRAHALHPHRPAGPA